MGAGAIIPLLLTFLILSLFACWPLLFIRGTRRKIICLFLWWGLCLTIGWSQIKPFLNLAVYSAHAVPIIHNLHNMVELYQTESRYLPGMQKPVSDVMIGGNSETQGTNGVRSRLHTWTKKPYKPAIWDYTNQRAVAISNHADSIFIDTRVTESNLADNRLHPCHIFYRVDYAGNNDDKYLYMIGVFGDGNGLAGGTGYAVLEINNPSVKKKYVLIWERYISVIDDGWYIPFLNHDEQVIPVSAAEKPFDAKIRKQNVCWIGDPEALMSDDPAMVEAALKDLHTAGWY